MANHKTREKFSEIFIKFHDIEISIEELEYELERYGDKNHKPSIDKNLLDACHSALNMKEETIKNMTEELTDRLSKNKSKWTDKAKDNSRDKSNKKTI